MECTLVALMVCTVYTFDMHYQLEKARRRLPVAVTLLNQVSPGTGVERTPYVCTAKGSWCSSSNAQILGG